MEIAPKTVEFIKQWIAGTYKQRQYQNYYQVKTEHANFLMKLTNKRELLAVRDPTGHIYMFDDNGDDDNGFAYLLKMGHTWPNGYTRVWSGRMGTKYGAAPKGTDYACNQISKFRVCERISLVQKWSERPLYISLIALGNRRFFTFPDHDWTYDTMPLKHWASFQFEADHKYLKHQPYSSLTECLPNIETIERIRGHYVDLANDTYENGAEVATVRESGWMVVPTLFNNIDEISGLPLLEMRKSRPNPYAFGISAAHFDIDKLVRRYETTEENISLLTATIREVNHRDVLNIDPETDWRGYLKQRFPLDMAQNYIDYIEADDRWLAANYDAAHAAELERVLRQPIGSVDGWVFAKKESDSRFGPYAIYHRNKNQPFDRIIPTPPQWSRIFGGKNDYE